MAPSPCADIGATASPPGLAPDEQGHLLAIARAVIAGESTDRTRNALTGLPVGLQAKRAVFVTLTRNGALRGCIGSLVATEPLAIAVAHAAHGAAFGDPRFPPLQEKERVTTRIEISVLSPLEPVAADSRPALLAALRPGIDGLLVEDGSRRSTFLPKVWEQLPEARDFLSHLLLKAGLPPDHWSPSLRAQRYTASSFAGDFATAGNGPTSSAT